MQVKQSNARQSNKLSNRVQYMNKWSALAWHVINDNAKRQRQQLERTNSKQSINQSINQSIHKYKVQQQKVQSTESRTTWNTSAGSTQTHTQTHTPTHTQTHTDTHAHNYSHTHIHTHIVAPLLEATARVVFDVFHVFIRLIHWFIDTLLCPCAPNCSRIYVDIRIAVAGNAVERLKILKLNWKQRTNSAGNQAEKKPNK